MMRNSGAFHGIVCSTGLGMRVLCWLLCGAAQWLARTKGGLQPFKVEYTLLTWKIAVK